MSSDGVLARYLRQSRLSCEVGNDPSSISPALTELWAGILDLFRFNDAGRPQLVVVRSPEPAVEMIAVSDDRFLVYDESLGDSFTRLNDLVRRDGDPREAMKWGLRQLAVALVGVDRLPEAVAAVLLGEQWHRRPFLPVQADTPSQALEVVIQLFFVITHECVHAALAQNLLGDLYTPEFDEVVDSALQINDVLQADPTIREKVDKEVEEDELQAIERGSRSFYVDRDAMEPRANLAHPDIRRLLKERPHLREELFCDYIATTFTCKFFEGMEVDRGETLPAILLALHNLSSLEAIRSLARDIADSTHHAQVGEVVVRKAVWRPLMLLMHQDTVGWKELGGRFADVTNSHARISDQFEFTLPAEFTHFLRQQRPDLRSRDMGSGVRTLVLRLADPAPERENRMAIRMLLESVVS